MFALAISMLVDINVAFADGDSKKVRKIFKKEKELNKMNRKAARLINEYLKNDSEKVRTSLYIFSTINKLERVGNHVSNIAENIIFYLEAKVIKHKGKK